MQVAMAQYERQGYICHHASKEELDEYNSKLPKEEPKPKRKSRRADGQRLREGEMLFEDRVKQMKAVQRMAKEEEVTIAYACDQIGIGYENYKSVCCAYRKGITKRS
jgi:hypothetical protein